MMAAHGTDSIIGSIKLLIKAGKAYKETFIYSGRNVEDTVSYGFKQILYVELRTLNPYSGRLKGRHSCSSILTNITKSGQGQGCIEYNRIFNWPFGLLGGHIGIMLAPRARGLWFEPPTNLKYFFERILCHSSYSYYSDKYKKRKKIDNFYEIGLNSVSP